MRLPMVDFFLVLMIAERATGCRGLQKGVLELADTVAINKNGQRQHQSRPK